MLLQRVKKICKSGVTVIVDRRDGTQWLGGLGAIYPVYGIDLNEKSVCLLFDLPQDDENRKVVNIPEDDLERTGLTLDDLVEDGETEELLMPMIWTLEYRGRKFEPLIAEDDTRLIIFVDSNYIAPLRDCDQLAFYARRMKSGDWYVAVKCGYKIVALMAAEKIPDSARVALSLISANADSVADINYRLGSLFSGGMIDD